MFGFIVYLVILGLVAGFIARVVGPCTDWMSVVAATLLGIAGGFIGYVLTDHDANHDAFQASAIIGSILGATVALLVHRAEGSPSHRSI